MPQLRALTPRPPHVSLAAGLRRAVGVALALLLLAFAAPALAANLYVANFGGTVSQYSVAADGTLAPLTPATVAAAAGTEGIALSPDRKSVYASNNTAPGSVSQYTVNADGTLTPKSPATVLATRASSITVSPNGRYVYVTSSLNPAVISQFDVAADGTLTPKTPATVAYDGNNGAAIVVNAAGTRAYVGHNGGTNPVSSFAIAADGSLSWIGDVAAGGGQTQGVALSPDGLSLYTANRGGNSVSRFAVSPLDGSLALAGTVGSGGAQPNRVTVSPDGKSVYAANQNAAANNIGQFDVAADGSLTPKSPATVSSPTTPKIVVFSTDGHNAYVPLQGSNNVGQFSVSAGGALTAKSPATVAGGSGPFEAVYSDGPAQPATTTLSTVASGSVAVGGGQLTASATLAGGSSPTGTVTFRVYGPGDTTCATALATSTATVTGNGVLGSAPYTPLAAGTYRWTAAYGGDAGNQAAGPTPCSDPAAAVVVVAGSPIALTGAASAIADTSASLAGSVTANGASTFYTFEYGTTPAFGSITDVPSAGNGATAQAVSAALSGLAPGTMYYYRLVATSSAGTSFGSVATFRTTHPPLVPSTVTGAASAVTNSGATVAGQVNPNGQQTAYTFEYGTSANFGSITQVVALDDADGLEPVSEALTGLTPDTTYYYRVVATNATGTSIGAVMSFSTGPGGAPIVSTGAASAIGATGATLSATVDAHGRPTAFAFEYGPSNAFGSLSAIDSAGASDGVQAVSLPITGLAPGTQYRYRIVATNSAGTTVGAVGTFSTSGP